MKSYKYTKPLEEIILEVIEKRKSSFKEQRLLEPTTQDAIQYMFTSKINNYDEHSIIENIQRRIVEESKFDYYMYFDPDNEALYSTSFNYRRAFLKTILEDLGLTEGKKLIYIEHPDNYEELLNEFKNYPRLCREIESLFSKSLVFGGYGVTVLMDTNTIEAIKFFSNGAVNGEDYTIVGYRNQRYNETAINPLWVLVHEVMHSYLESGDEQKVQKETFDWLFKYGYYNSIGIEFLRYINAEIYNKQSFIRNYSIIDYMIDKLSKKEPKILNTYIAAAVDVIEAVEGTTRLKDTMYEVLINILTRNNIDIDIKNVYKLPMKKLDNYNYRVL